MPREGLKRLFDLKDSCEWRDRILAEDDRRQLYRNMNSRRHFERMDRSRNRSSYWNTLSQQEKKCS